VFKRANTAYSWLVFGDSCALLSFYLLYIGSTKTSTKYGHWGLDKNEEAPNVFEIRKRTEEGKVEPRLLSMARLSYRLK
jgi:hypothetical protein